MRRGALCHLRPHPIRVDAAEGLLRGVPDGAFFIRQGQDERFDGPRPADLPQRLGYRLAHIAVGVREQG